MRRQAPYRLIARSRLGAEALEGLRALLATEVAKPTPAERKILMSFAEGGGLLVGWSCLGPGVGGRAFYGAAGG
jgi:hypothetical protein